MTPASRPPAWGWAAVAAIGALPTLVSAAWAPTLLADDWGFAAVARRQGFLELLRGVDNRSRPLQALYHAVSFTLLGDHVVAHLVVLAALNAAVAVMVLAVAWRAFTPRVAVLVTACWLVLGNHGATRLWIATAPISVSVLLLLAAAWFAVRARPSLIAVVSFGALSALSYEGGIAIAGGLVLLAVWRRSTDTGTRVREALVGGGVLGAVGVWILLTSPKALKGSTPFEPGRVLSSGLGSALLPVTLRPLSVLLLIAVVLSLVTLALPSFRRQESVAPLTSGVVVFVLGAAPFVFAKFPLSTDGMLDRVNVYLALGAALLLAGTLDQLWRLPQPAAATLAGLVLVALASANVADVRDAHQAHQEARRTLAALEAFMAQVPAGSGPWLVPPSEGQGGWAPFGYDSIGGAFYLRTGQVVDVRDSVDEAQFTSTTGNHLEWRNGRFVFGCIGTALTCG